MKNISCSGEKEKDSCVPPITLWRVEIFHVVALSRHTYTLFTINVDCTVTSLVQMLL